MKFATYFNKKGAIVDTLDFNISCNTFGKKAVELQKLNALEHERRMAIHHIVV